MKSLLLSAFILLPLPPESPPLPGNTYVGDVSAPRKEGTDILTVRYRVLEQDGSWSPVQTEALQIPVTDSMSAKEKATEVSSTINSHKTQEGNQIAESTSLNSTLLVGGLLGSGTGQDTHLESLSYANNTRQRKVRFAPVSSGGSTATGAWVQQASRSGGGPGVVGFARLSLISATGRFAGQDPQDAPSEVRFGQDGRWVAERYPGPAESVFAVLDSIRAELEQHGLTVYWVGQDTLELAVMGAPGASAGQMGFLAVYGCSDIDVDGTFEIRDHHGN
jgi:hypothetical protein